MSAGDDDTVGSLLCSGEPGFRPPMLATLAELPVADGNWVYERKHDGYRIVAVRDGGSVRLWTRNQLERTAAFPEVVDALLDQPAERFVVDGEVVAFEGSSVSFSLLQRRAGVSDPRAARSSGIPVRYVLFDVLHLNGVDVDRLPLDRRQALLRDAFVADEPLALSEASSGDPGALLEDACRQGWEGLIAKRVDAPYRPGRSRDWLKLKCLAEQEFVVGGWTDPKGSRNGFGSLLVGYHDGEGALVYAGKVGTGFDEAALRSVSSRLAELGCRHCPFERQRPTGRGLHWVEPRLVAQVAFSEWTGGGQLRHPRFLGLRDDKDPSEVVRERPQVVPR